jgi:hypothetical protein
MTFRCWAEVGEEHRAKRRINNGTERYILRLFMVDSFAGGRRQATGKEVQNEK